MAWSCRPTRTSTKRSRSTRNLLRPYRHRGDNLKRLWDTPEGKDLLKQRAENYREKYEKARSSNLTKTPWQPLNTTAGNTTIPLALNQMRQVDYLRAKEIEAGIVGGYGGYGGGYGINIGGGIKIGGPGYGVAGPGPGGKIVGNPALAVYPEEVVLGEKITLVANPAELIKNMPVQLGANGKPIRRRGAYGKDAPREPIYGVDFYRDVDGDGTLDPGADQYLASDNNGKDGFSTEVSTAGFTPGNQAFFAVGRGEQPAGVPTTFEQAAEALKKAAAKQREIAQQAAAATETGFSTEKAPRTLRLPGRHHRTGGEAGLGSSIWRSRSGQVDGGCHKADDGCGQSP